MTIRDRLRDWAQREGFDLPPLLVGETTAFLPVRQTPKGTRIEVDRPGEVQVRFRAVVRFWFALPYVLGLITLFGSVPLGGFIGYFFNPFDGYRSQGAWQSWMSFWLFSTPILFLAATIISYRLTHLWVKLVATQHYIRVGSYYFDRTKYGGMRIGYEIKTTGNLLKNDFHDLSIGMQALRLSYGPWGEDLPYLVNKYHANEIVLWLNIMIARTMARPAGPTDTATGQRPQAF